MKESGYRVVDLETVIWGEGSCVGVVGKRSVFGVKYVNGEGNLIVPAGGKSPRITLKIEV